MIQLLSLNLLGALMDEPGRLDIVSYVLAKIATADEFKSYSTLIEYPSMELVYWFYDNVVCDQYWIGIQ